MLPFSCFAILLKNTAFSPKLRIFKIKFVYFFEIGGKFKIGDGFCKGSKNRENQPWVCFVVSLQLIGTILEEVRLPAASASLLVLFSFGLFGLGFLDSSEAPFKELVFSGSLVIDFA